MGSYLRWLLAQCRGGPPELDRPWLLQRTVCAHGDDYGSVVAVLREGVSVAVVAFHKMKLERLSPQPQEVPLGSICYQLREVGASHAPGFRQMQVERSAMIPWHHDWGRWRPAQMDRSFEPILYQYPCLFLKFHAETYGVQSVCPGCAQVCWFYGPTRENHGRGKQNEAFQRLTAGAKNAIVTELLTQGKIASISININIDDVELISFAARCRVAQRSATIWLGRVRVTEARNDRRSLVASASAAWENVFLKPSMACETMRAFDPVTHLNSRNTLEEHAEGNGAGRSYHAAAPTECDRRRS